ncbi:MAG: amidohydrolase [Deltaproteobacteria bacterium]|nr:MAG: amidohydrolase [Deltaproteobacteria bacterium]
MPKDPKLDWVIDADTHITEPADVWTSRVPAKFRDKAPHIVRNDDGVDIWQIGDHAPLVPVGHTAVAGWKEPFPAAPRNMDEVPKASYDAKARLDYMDEIGIWAMALYPNVGGFGNQGFLKLGDPELMLACVRAYNDFLIDWIEPNPDRFIPIMATPFWDVDASVKEIERCAKLGHKGVLFAGEPQDLGQPFLGEKHWDRFYAAAQDADLPISFHIGSANFTEEFSPERVAAHGIAPTVVRSTVSILLENGKSIVDLLLSGVLPHFPKLKFVSVESGIGWIPFLLEAADHCFKYANVSAERPEFTMLPSEYFARQVYGCYFFEELAPQRLIDVIGEDNIMFETDYPHPVCLYGNVRQKIDAGLVGQPERIRRKLLFDNAAKLYKVAAPTA